MALYPNGRFMSRSPGRHFGVAPGLDPYLRGQGDRFNRFVGQTFARTASTPDGYDVQGTVPAIRAGSMAGVGRTEVSGIGNLLQGGPMEGSGSISFTPSAASLSLIVSMSGTATLTLTSSGNVLRLVVGMSGAGSLSFTGAGGLSMIVPFDGSGAFGIAGSGDLKGRLSMAGSWTPFSTLSPENLAAAVWSAAAAANNEAGSMGNKLNSAASGGVDLNALAIAVWTYATRTLTAGGGSAPTADEVADAVRVELEAELTRLTKMAKIHGVGVPLVVTPTSRTAGDVVQNISTVGDTTTVSAA